MVDAASGSCHTLPETMHASHSVTPPAVMEMLLARQQDGEDSAAAGGAAETALQREWPGASEGRWKR